MQSAPAWELIGRLQNTAAGYGDRLLGDIQILGVQQDQRSPGRPALFGERETSNFLAVAGRGENACVAWAVFLEGPAECSRIKSLGHFHVGDGQLDVVERMV